MTKAEAAVVRAARAYWRSQRPSSWRLRDHLKDPAFYAMNRPEERLLRAVADLYRPKSQRKTGRK